MPTCGGAHERVYNSPARALSLGFAFIVFTCDAGLLSTLLLMVLFAGEYVLMVEDVTDPPFMGITLAPAFIQIKLVLPKKVKKEKVKKEKPPR